jgi:ankyrin repeat protein
MSIELRLQEILGAELFPAHLCQKYPHLAERIAEAWGTPALDVFLSELFFDRRGGRQGFEPEVMHELFTIQNRHQELFNLAPNDSPLWDAGSLDTQDLRADQSIYDVAAMMDAARNGKIAFISEGLSNGFQINRADPAGLTMLWWAARSGHRELMLTLLTAHARVDIYDDFGCAAVHWLAAQDLVSGIELIHKHGANLDVADNEGVTPLMYAAHRGRVAAAECLIKLGAQINKVDRQGMTALHHAADASSAPMLKLLKLHQANLQLKDGKGRSAFDIAEQKPDAQRLIFCLAP